MIRISAFALCLIASGAAAQTVSNGAGIVFSPADPARSRPVEYRSVFGPDRPADNAADWRQANDEMGRVGGHVGQLRDASPSASDASKSVPDATAAAPVPPQHRH